MSGDPSIEGDRALRTNVAAFDKIDVRGQLVSPHLKHQGLRNLHRRLITLAAESAGPSIATMSVLELGAGDGLGSAPWFELGVARVVAVDPSPVMLERFAARAAASGITAEVACMDGDRFFATHKERFDVVSFARGGATTVFNVADATAEVVLPLEQADGAPGEALCGELVGRVDTPWAAADDGDVAMDLVILVVSEGHGGAERDQMGMPRGKFGCD